MVTAQKFPAANPNRAKAGQRIRNRHFYENAVQEQISISRAEQMLNYGMWVGMESQSYDHHHATAKCP